MQKFLFAKQTPPPLSATIPQNSHKDPPQNSTPQNLVYYFIYLIFYLIMASKVDRKTKLKQTIDYARRNPTLSMASIARRYEINVTTLSRRIAGTQQSYRASHEDQPLFTPGDESAIVNHCMIMAECGFPLSHELLGSIAQDILNDHLQTTTTSATMTTDTHTIGVHWICRVLRIKRQDVAVVKNLEKAAARKTADAVKTAEAEYQAAYLRCSTGSRTA